MKYLVINLSFVLILLLPNTSSGQGRSTVKEIFQIQSDFRNGIVLAEIEGIAVDKEQNIYLLDYGSWNCNKKVDNQLSKSCSLFLC